MSLAHCSGVSKRLLWVREGQHEAEGEQEW